MKLLVNAINLVKGGAIQVALSFIEECRVFSRHEFHMFVSSPIYSQLRVEDFPPHIHFYTNPDKSNRFLRIFSNVRFLKQQEKIIRPDCVFSIFGPAYWTPAVPHLSGFAIPHYIYPESPYFNQISFSSRLRLRLMKTIHVWFLRRNAAYYVTETEDVRQRLSILLRRNPSDCYHVSNTAHGLFNTFVKTRSFLPERRQDEFRLVTISAFYPHKNLGIIPRVVEELKKRSQRPFIFLLTIPEQEYRAHFSMVASSVVNIGPIPISDCPSLYSEADALFLPTLLECFSASYAEAMAMGKPVLTSDLPFARSICGDAAHYFNPVDPADIAARIIELSGNRQLYDRLVRQGRERLKEFASASSRSARYIEICEKISTAS